MLTTALLPFRQLRARWSGKSTIETVRLAFLLLALASVIRTVLALLSQVGSGTVPVWVSLVAGLALFTVSTWGWSRGRFSLWVLPIDGLAIFLLGASMDDPIGVVGVFFTTLHLRNLYGGHRQAIARTLMFAAALAVLFRSATLGYAAEDAAGAMALLIPPLLTMAVMIRVMAVCLNRLEAARRTSAVLAASAGEMLATDRPGHVRELTEAAAEAIVTGSHILTTDDNDPAWTDTVASDERVLVLPFAEHGEIYGRLIVRTVDRVSPAQREALQTLVAHATSALASICLRSTLHHRANHDPLTDLPNRALFTELLTRVLAEHERHAAVIFIDLDDFKWVNDNLGHGAGDTLLKEVAAALRQCLRSTDVPARLGGDEFAVLVDDIAGANAVAQRLLSVLERPVDLHGHSYEIKCSIGIAASVGSAGGSPVAQVRELLRRADAAMYQAKASGKNRYRVYEDVAPVRGIHDAPGLIRPLV